MKCRRARQLLFDFVDGMSNETLRAELDRHLGECGECERFADEMTRSLALLRRTPAEPLGEDFNWKVRLAIHRERKQAHSRAESVGVWARAWNFRYVASAAVAFGVVLVAGTLVLRDGARSPSAPQDVARVEPDRPTGVLVSPPLVPRRSQAFGRVGTGLMVSNGESANAFRGVSHGAIDEATVDATIDSLVSFDLMRMTREQREAYIQRRILRLQLHLQGQQANPERR